MSNQLNYKISSLKQNIQNKFIVEFNENINLLERIKLLKNNMLLVLKYIQNLAKLSIKDKIYDITSDLQIISKIVEVVSLDITSIFILGQNKKKVLYFTELLLGQNILKISENSVVSPLIKIRHIQNFINVKNGDIQLEYKKQNDIMKNFLSLLEKLDDFCNRENILKYIKIDDIKSLLNNKDSIQVELLKIKTQYIEKKYIKMVIKLKEDLNFILNNLEKVIEYLDRSIFISSENFDISEEELFFISEIIFYKKITLFQNVELIISLDNKVLEDVNCDAILKIKSHDTNIIKEQISNLFKKEQLQSILSQRVYNIENNLLNINISIEKNLENLRQTILVARKKQKGFKQNKPKILEQLKNELMTCLDKNYILLITEIEEHRDKLIEKYAKKRFFIDKANQSSKFKNITKRDNNQYEKSAKEFSQSLIFSMNQDISTNMQDIFHKYDSLLEKEVLNKFEMIQSEYEHEYNLKINIADVSLNKVDIQLANNINFQLGFWETIQMSMNIFSRNKAGNYIDLYGSKWEEYISDKYKKMLKTEILATIYMSKNKTSLAINEEIEDTLNAIDTQLRQQVIDQLNLQKNSKDLMSQKKLIKKEFIYIQNHYIKLLKEQKDNLLKGTK
jgi:hypothetical protein